ncbi:MAG TPA: hypothetical protein VL688_04950 [Verrucomicrobiae bacterium]|nr:hypothetical protein [Verrucomicrobiae bacterium]
MSARTIHETILQNKFISLLLLRRALIEENYEACAALVSAAKYYQSTSKEIRKVLTNPDLHPENLEIDEEPVITAGKQKVSER